MAGGSELLIVLIVVVIVFGGSWLPKAARNLGRAKVELDDAQKKLNETTAQVIEATGIEKADQALKKANRALNSSPQSMLRDAARSAMQPARPESKGSTDEPDPDDAPADSGDSQTVNIDFTDE